MASLPATAAVAAAVAEAMAEKTGVGLRVLLVYKGPQTCCARVWVVSYSVDEQLSLSQAAVAARLPESHWQVRFFEVVKAQGLDYQVEVRMYDGGEGVGNVRIWL